MSRKKRTHFWRIAAMALLVVMMSETTLSYAAGAESMEQPKWFSKETLQKAVQLPLITELEETASLANAQELDVYTGGGIFRGS